MSPPSTLYDAPDAPAAAPVVTHVLSVPGTYAMSYPKNAPAGDIIVQVSPPSWVSAKVDPPERLSIARPCVSSFMRTSI